MGETITLKTVYREVRRVREMLEELAERSLLNVLPEEETSREERKELTKAEDEIKRGEYVTLEEVRKKLKGKQSG